MAEYTQGKWESIYIARENGASYVVCDGKVIASIKKHFGEEQAKANAHLIAAAPAMYEALRAVESGRGELYDNAWLKVLDALKLARGE